MYLDLAREQDVRVKKGREMFRLVYETPDEQPLLTPDDDFRRAISMEEFKDRVLAMVERLDKKYAR
jgi:hypothetical protein